MIERERERIKKEEKKRENECSCFQQLPLKNLGFFVFLTIGAIEIGRTPRSACCLI